MSDAVVELRDVFCVHRTNEGDAAALAGTNLQLASGEVLGVLGPRPYSPISIGVCHAVASARAAVTLGSRSAGCRFWSEDWSG